MTHQLDLIIVDSLDKIAFWLVATGLNNIGAFTSQDFAWVHDALWGTFPCFFKNQITVAWVQIVANHVERGLIDMFHIADDFFLLETIGVLLMWNYFFNLLTGIGVSPKEVCVNAEERE